MSRGVRSFLISWLAAVSYYASQGTTGNANGWHMDLPGWHMDQQVALVQLDIAGRQHVRGAPCQLTRFLEPISELFHDEKGSLTSLLSAFFTSRLHHGSVAGWEIHPSHPSQLAGSPGRLEGQGKSRSSYPDYNEHKIVDDHCCIFCSFFKVACHTL